MCIKRGYEMSSQLISFVSPLTGSLESLQNQFSQLAALHREAHTSLRSQGSSLTAIGGAEAFIGDGARAFTDVIAYYITASEKHMQSLDDASTAAGSCISEIMDAVGYASSIYLDEGMVGYVIERLTQDTIIREGAAPVGAIVN